MFSLREKVVSLAAIAKLAEHVDSITVPHNAVITPSARDELRHRNVRVQRETKIDLKPSLIVANANNRGDLDAIRKVATLNVIAGTELPVLISKLTTLMSEDTRGLITTDNPEQALVLANRTAGATAFFGYSIQNIHRARTTIQPNVMILDPAATTTQLKNYVRTFVNH